MGHLRGPSYTYSYKTVAADEVVGLDLSVNISFFWYMLLLSIGLVLFAGLMSGLTLGLLSMERLDLRVTMLSGNDKEKIRAQKVANLLKHEHLLLVTLLLFNALAMEALPVVLGRIVPETYAILISVTAVLFFGEILPQAICKAFGLAIGAAAAPLVKVLMAVIIPVSWPIAKFLDRVVGHDDQRGYQRNEMAAIIQIHCEDGHITKDEETVMKGALAMVHKTCSVCMTPIDRVKSLPDNARLDEATLDWIIQSGHSRIPVHFASDRHFLRGVLLTKKLLRRQAGETALVSSVELTPMMCVNEDTELYKILDMFQTGRSHMAAVYPTGVDLGENAASTAKALGIVTLEDVLEELLEEEIVDETDQYVHAEDPKSTSAEEWRTRLLTTPVKRKSVRCLVLPRKVRSAESVRTLVLPRKVRSAEAV